VSYTDQVSHTDGPADGGRAGSGGAGSGRARPPQAGPAHAGPPHARPPHGRPPQAGPPQARGERAERAQADSGAGASAGQRASLRAEQVAQTRAALVSAGRLLFGTKGFAATSVEDIAREARVTTGALYHHFRTKAAVFEAVFEQVHADMLAASMQAAAAPVEATTPAGHENAAVELLAAGFDAFLDKVLEPEVQRIIITDAPAVLGLTRFIELDERYAFAAMVEALEAADASGYLRVDDAPTLARLLLGALTRAGLLIASSPEPRATRDSVSAALRTLLTGFTPRRG
jgi:AcrR family transcriptional regulator